jgi:hypothetical protein
MLERKFPGCIDWRAAEALRRRALNEGGKNTSMLSTEWNIAGSCDNPMPVELNGRMYSEFSRGNDGEWDFLKGQRVVAGALPHALFLKVPCRKCASCRNFKAMIWRARMQDEIDCAPRTWFCTFTLNPESQYELKIETAARLRNGGTDYWSLPWEDRKKEFEKTVVRHMTLYIKRLRKKAKLRYAYVLERHKSGIPHVHAIIHEMDARMLKYANVSSTWKLGFEKCKLIDESDEAAQYIAKYIAKDGTRMRASFRYGAADVELARRSQRNSCSSTMCPSAQEEKTTPSPSLFSGNGGNDIPF